MEEKRQRTRRTAALHGAGALSKAPMICARHLHAQSAVGSFMANCPIGHAG